MPANMDLTGTLDEGRWCVYDAQGRIVAIHYDSHGEPASVAHGHAVVYTPPTPEDVIARRIAAARPVLVACCPEHGLHGQRDRCFVCDREVQQVPMRRIVNPDGNPLYEGDPARAEAIESGALTLGKGDR